jgi:hypothetical protein
MLSSVLAYVAAGVVGLWGVAHVLPTARVVHGFSDTSRDNRLVITQEWIAEGMTMWLIATVVIIAAALGSSHHAFGDWVYRTPVIFFKICPVLLCATAALLLTASWVQVDQSGHASLRYA